MQIKPVEHSSLYCLFADELRRELDGRDTVVGWYPDGAKIPMPAEGPAVLARLMTLAIVMTPLQITPQDMTFSLVLNDAVIHTHSVPRQHFEDSLVAANSDDVGPLRAGVFRMAMQAQNLQINEPGRLRVRVVMGDLVLDSNSLHFIRP